jgi:predicted nucleic acid-binding protein
VREDRLLITPIVRMEILCSARSSSEYLELGLELNALRILRSDRAVADAAMSALGELAGRSDGYHRVPLTDALTAAAAAEQGGLAVLHRDAHFDRLAEAIPFDSVTLPVPSATPVASPRRCRSQRSSTSDAPVQGDSVEHVGIDDRFARAKRKRYAAALATAEGDTETRMMPSRLLGLAE